MLQECSSTGGRSRSPELPGALNFSWYRTTLYASSTVGGNTRKYHGLFVRDGRLLLAGLDERVNGIQLSSQQYQGVANDGGLRYLAAFSAYPPSWVYWIDGIIVKKTITFDGSLSVTYDITGDADLWIRPLITDRPVHGVMRDPAPGCTNEPDGFRWGEIFFHGDLPYEASPVTYRNLWYQREYERGYGTGGGSLFTGCFPGTGKEFCRPVPLHRRSTQSTGPAPCTVTPGHTRLAGPGSGCILPGRRDICRLPLVLRIMGA